LASYHGTGSTGKIRTLIPLAESVAGRHVIILEDIVDSGLTLSHLIKVLKKQKPASIKTACMLFKPDALQHKLTLDYVGFEVPNDFLVGFGLDYDGHGRNLKDIYTLVK
ncbi:MAG: phosphoribosyltransferase family protein, partial [Bacteroidota bacterium]